MKKYLHTPAFRAAPLVLTIGLFAQANGSKAGEAPKTILQLQEAIKTLADQGPVPSKDSAMAKAGQALTNLYNEHKAYQQRGDVQVFKPRTSAVRVQDSYVAIDAVASGDPSVLQADLEKLGMKNIATFGRVVSGLLPISAIEQMSTLPSLQFARPAYAETHSGLVTSQGDLAMRADAARAVSGVDGSGITVGVLSDSFNCLGGAASDVASGDLPSGIVVLQDEVGCVLGSDEGRAMMQLIHDVAPGASLSFHTAFLGEANFAQGIIDLANAGAKVIVDDVGFPTEPMFQDGNIAQAVNTVAGRGVSYFSAAGNSGRFSYETPFRSSGIFIDESGGLGLFFCEAHDFDPSPDVGIFQHITIPMGSGFTMSFQWDSPFFSVSGAPGSPSDLDVALFDDFGTLVAISIDLNIGGDPVEVFHFFNPPGSGVSGFNVLITNCGGPNPDLTKYVLSRFNGTIDQFNTASSTLFGHPNAAGAAAVGAAPYFSTPVFGINPPLLEVFSSAGGTPILFQTNGAPTFELREKPEIVAPDGTNTTFFGGPDIELDGFPNFSGTSAAAPHAAAVAALMLEANSALSPSQIYTALKNTAIDMDDPLTLGFDSGFDFASGFGLIQADAAVQSIAPPPPPPPPPPSQADLAVTQSDSPDPVVPGSSLTYTLNVANNGPASATAVTLTDTLPAGVIFVSASSGCAPAGGTVSCNLGNLTSGSSATANILVIPTVGGPINNTVQVSSTTADSNAANNTTTETTTVIVDNSANADLSISTRGKKKVKLGKSLTYKLTVKNKGPSPATGVTLIDTLPAGVTLVSAPNCTQISSTIITCPIGDLGKNKKAKRKIVVRPTAAGSISNAAVVTSSTADPNRADNTASAVTTVQ